MGLRNDIHGVLIELVDEVDFADDVDVSINDYLNRIINIIDTYSSIDKVDSIAKDNMGLPYAWGMYTSAANDALREAFRDLLRDADMHLISRVDLPATVNDMCVEVFDLGWREIWDTEVQENIAYHVNKMICEPNMWKPFDRWEI